MKPHLLVVLALVGIGAAAHAQEFRKTLSLEIGAGPGPYHMMWEANDWSYEDRGYDFADKGQDAVGGYYPAVTVSAALRTWDRWETVATFGVSWSHRQIIQYDTFGIDPQGKPRYDLQKGTPAGWRDLAPVWSLTVQERVYWNPRWRVQMYSGWGLGVVKGSDTFVLPSFTPVGCRLGGRHFYGYVEAPLSTYARFLHAGLGWTF